MNNTSPKLHLINKIFFLFFIIIIAMITTMQIRASLEISTDIDISTTSQEVLETPMSPCYLEKLKKRNESEKVIINKSDQKITVLFIKNLSKPINVEIGPDHMRIIKYSGPNFNVEEISSEVEFGKIPAQNINSKTKFIFRDGLFWESY